VKKIISILLAVLIMLASSVAVCAEDEVNLENIVNTIVVTIEEPRVGELPAKTGSTPSSASTYVIDVSWSGDFDENGCFKSGEDYVVLVGVAIKPGLDKGIDSWYTKNFTINGKEAIFEYLDASGTSGVMYYKYQRLGMGHQNHCYCGGELTLGDHTSHKQYEYKPWDGESSIEYEDNVAYVYLTDDVSRENTLRVPGGKTLNLCLNGNTIRKSGGDRVINISSGGKLRLCDCSAMNTGKITGGSHEMGGGIHNGGTFVMYGGKIIGNKSAYGGGLWNNYCFYMYGGEITQNSASYGGGVWNANSGDADLIIYGGSINKNEAGYGGGMWNNDNGNVSMKGGEFRENIASKCGGALWNQGKNFFMEDGYIYKNFACQGGGVWTQSTFTMSGGYIVANEAFFPYDRESGNGGGVWVSGDSIFQMKNGEISGNLAAMGGGVWLSGGADFVMQGGRISGNDAELGGGVYIQRDDGVPGIFRLSGESEVRGNRGKTAGGGMYVQGVLEVTGGMVDGNISDSEFANLAIEPDAEVREGTSLPTEFIDVPRDAYYYEPVLWALENNITKGTSEITFSPDDECNIGQIMTFLWRASGCPEAETTPRLADVKKDDYYYMPAYWGQSLGMFERALYPNFSCSRMSAVYFIWCAAGKPECNVQLEFTDIDTEKYAKYCESIAWAVEQGIANGTSDTTFSPGKTCSRAEIITFLWRADLKGWI